MGYSWSSYGSSGLYAPDSRVIEAGVIPEIDYGHPDAQGLLFFWVDTGTGFPTTLVDSWPGHPWYPPNQFAPYTGGTPPNPFNFKNGTNQPPTSYGGFPNVLPDAYGGSIAWPNDAGGTFRMCSAQITEGSPPFFTATSDACRQAVDLYSAPVGAGWTVAAGHFQVGGGGNGLGPTIWGRPSAAREAGSTYVCLLFGNGTGPGDTTHRQINFGWDNANASNTLTSSLNPPLGTYCVSAGTAQVVSAASSPHTSTCALFVNGAPQGTAIGQVPIDAFASDARFPTATDNDESQWMIGSNYHLTVGDNSFGVWNGGVKWGGFWARPDLNGALAANLYNAGVFPAFVVPGSGQRRVLI
jgi:hypothetical protein